MHNSLFGYVSAKDREGNGFFIMLAAGNSEHRHSAGLALQLGESAVVTQLSNAFHLLAHVDDQIARLHARLQCGGIRHNVDDLDGAVFGIINHVDADALHIAVQAVHIRLELLGGIVGTEAIARAHHVSGQDTIHQFGLIELLDVQIPEQRVHFQQFIEVGQMGVGIRHLLPMLDRHHGKRDLKRQQSRKDNQHNRCAKGNFLFHI